MRVLVTGSNGFIGRHLVPRLRDEGDEVFLLARGSTSPGGNPFEVGAPVDLADIAAGAPWPDGLDLVIHLAALNPARGAKGASDLAALTRANSDGTAALALRAAQEGIARFLFLSTANVQAANEGRPAIEEDECDPGDAYARSKLQAEEGLRRSLAGTGTRWTVLRPAAVYGQGGHGALASLQRLAHSRLPLPFASMKARRSVLSVENLVDAILLARAHPAARDETFLVADDEPPSLTELVEMMREARERPSRQFPLPTALVRAGLALAGRREIGVRMSRSFIVDTSRIRLRLGWRPRLTTREAFGATAFEATRNGTRSWHERPSAA